MHIVLDANVLISFALKSKQLEPLKEVWQAKEFTTLICQELLSEVSNVLNRDKFSKLITKPKREKFIQDISLVSLLVYPKPPFPEFTDPKDEYLLAILRDNDADILVTGDKRLLELETYVGKAILSPRDFMDKYIT